MPIKIDLAGDKFNGILSYFLKNSSQLNDFVVATASTNQEKANLTLFPNSQNSFFTTIGNNPQWYMAEFKKSICGITSYTLESSWNLPDSEFHLRGWKMLGSIDKKQWDVIHEINDSQVMNGNGVASNFPTNEGLYRFFKLVQTEPGIDANYGFSIRRIEIFGTLYNTGYVPLYHHCTIFHKRSSLLHINIFLFCFMLLQN